MTRESVTNWACLAVFIALCLPGAAFVAWLIVGAIAGLA